MVIAGAIRECASSSSSLLSLRKSINGGSITIGRSFRAFVSTTGRLNDERTNEADGRGEVRETETVGRRATGEKERNRDRLPGE